MRRFLALILALSVIAACLSGCAPGEETESESGETDYTCRDIAAAVIASQTGLPELYAVDSADPAFDAYGMIYLGELAEYAVDGVICIPIGPHASETAVFELSSPLRALAAAEPLQSYISSRAAAFFGYAPEESALAEKGEVMVRGSFAAIAICEDPEEAKSAFDACFGDGAPEPPELSGLTSPPPEPQQGGTEPDEPEEDEYDHDAVTAAFSTGDTSALTPKNLAVYDKCVQIIGEVIEPRMTEYEKELAINDYLVYNIEYDPLELSHTPGLSSEPDNDDPYGALVHGCGICLGYASSFQLLMDILGIRCVTVHGFAHNWEEDHAWNVVELDGEWYCVDVTWNDPVFTGWTPDEATRFAYAHVYFNVTSDYMLATDHQWTDPDAPEAAGTKYAYRP